jgi:putative hydrolase of the HAD superfamily
MPVVIRAALFDLGGVILSSPFEAFAIYERDHDLPDGFLRRVNTVDPDTNAWARLERGDVDLEQFGDLFSAEALALGQAVDGHQVLGLLAGEIRPAMVEAVRRCGDRMITGLLTNNFIAVNGRGMQDTALSEVLDLFDAVIKSSRVGVRKPDPVFYEIACESLGVAPSEAVFLDDLGINLKPARAMGMVTIKVTDPDLAITELEQVVGFPLS